MSGGQSGGGMKGIMMLAMVFVFGAAAFLAARSFEHDMCTPFAHNMNVESALGTVQKCSLAPKASWEAKQPVVVVKGSAGRGQIAIQRRERTIIRAYLTVEGSDAPILVFGADPMVNSSRVMTQSDR